MMKSAPSVFNADAAGSDKSSAVAGPGAQANATFGRSEKVTRRRTAKRKYLE
jgi:hypothetical protein